MCDQQSFLLTEDGPGLFLQSPGLSIMKGIIKQN
jgi:hypothetical protein